MEESCSSCPSSNKHGSGQSLFVEGNGLSRGHCPLSIVVGPVVESGHLLQLPIPLALHSTLLPPPLVVRSFSHKMTRCQSKGSLTGCPFQGFHEDWSQPWTEQEGRKFLAPYRLDVQRLVTHRRRSPWHNKRPVSHSRSEQLVVECTICYRRTHLLRAGRLSSKHDGFMTPSIQIVQTEENLVRELCQLLPKLTLPDLSHLVRPTFLLRLLCKGTDLLIIVLDLRHPKIGTSMNISWRSSHLPANILLTKSPQNRASLQAPASLRFHGG